MGESCSNFFQIKFWPLALLNIFIHATYPSSSKKKIFLPSFMVLAVVTLSFSMTRVPTILVCVLVWTLWFDERAYLILLTNSLFADVVTNLLRSYLCDAWLPCSRLRVGEAQYFIMFPSPPANHVFIKKIRWPWFLVGGDYNLDVNSVHFQSLSDEKFNDQNR